MEIETPLFMKQFECDVCKNITHLVRKIMFSQTKHICNVCEEQYDQFKDDALQIYLQYCNEFEHSIETVMIEYDIPKVLAVMLVTEGSKQYTHNLTTDI